MLSIANYSMLVLVGDGYVDSDSAIINTELVCSDAEVGGGRGLGGLHRGRQIVCGEG